MPVLQQLLVKSYRGCHFLAHMQLSPASSRCRLPQLQAHQQQAGLWAVGAPHHKGPVQAWQQQQQQQQHTCRACAKPFAAAGTHYHTSSSSSSSSSLGGSHQLHSWGRRPSSSSTGASRQPSWLTRAAASQPDSTSQPSEGGTPPPTKFLTLPTILTLARVAAIPALIAAWFWQDPAASTVVTLLFVAASLTDWLDGYLARKMNASTPFGAFLDPVADKLMVAAVLILLSTQPLAAGPLAGNAWLVPTATLVIIGREITMSALREWAATMGPAARAAVAVNSLGKWKTASQMVALTCLLMTKDGAAGQVGQLAAAAGTPLLGVAAYLTAHSLAVYMAGLWRFMK